MRTGYQKSDDYEHNHQYLAIVHCSITSFQPKISAESERCQSLSLWQCHGKQSFDFGCEYADNIDMRGTADRRY